MTLLASILATVFALLALLHVHWAFGGRSGWRAVIPEVGGRPAFVPGTGVTVLVATLLAGCAVLLLVAAGIIALPVSGRWIEIALGALALVLTARALGDFRLVGFTKRVRGTRFARLDDIFYSPLCLLLALGVGTMAVLHGR
jgi:purine-cytosine permease-like protein